jgi:hypothetical protein
MRGLSHKRAFLRRKGFRQEKSHIQIDAAKYVFKFSQRTHVMEPEKTMNITDMNYL